MAPSRKRKTSATADGDTREVKRRDTAASPSTSHDYCESQPAAQEIPWDMYDDVDDDDDDDDDDYDDEQQDDEFTFSPASPPLTETTKGEEEEEEETAPPMLYVFPDSTVVLTPDGSSVRIPDRPANQPESPEPSTSHTYASHMNTEVCKIMIEESVSHIITNEWRTSSQTLEEVTTNICKSIKATILSPEWHELMKYYARINIRRQQ